MGRILDSYGDVAYDHEGYAAQVLDDRTLTSTYSHDTERRMIGQVVPACGCGWTGTTRYPTTGPFDETAKELALGEWERQHARPVLEGQRVEIWEQLRTGVRQLAESHATITRARFSDLSPAEQRVLLDRALASLERAIELARQLREPVGLPVDWPSQPPPEGVA
ncbi:MAG: hypothetical protein M3460_10950 [Actinomycetota bacterium]|nr:hypothetical protein [Actinomycetota bacterium]